MFPERLAESLRSKVWTTFVKILATISVMPTKDRVHLTVIIPEEQIRNPI